jgi:hypothetical protein
VRRVLVVYVKAIERSVVKLMSTDKEIQLRAIDGLGPIVIETTNGLD